MTYTCSYCKESIADFPLNTLTIAFGSVYHRDCFTKKESSRFSSEGWSVSQKDQMSRLIMEYVDIKTGKNVISLHKRDELDLLVSQLEEIAKGKENDGI